MESSILTKYQETFYQKKGFIINLIVVITFNKTEQPKEKIGIYLGLLELLCFHACTKMLMGRCYFNCCIFDKSNASSCCKIHRSLACLKKVYPQCRITSNLPLKALCLRFLFIYPMGLVQNQIPGHKSVLFGYAPNKKRYKCF